MNNFILRLLLLISCSFTGITSSYAHISKLVAGLTIYSSVYGNNNPKDYPAYKFPNPYSDLQNYSDVAQNKLLTLSYLDYGDGGTVFSRYEALFNPKRNITKLEALELFLEAWSIPQKTTGTLPYKDVSWGNGVYTWGFGYINRAYSLGIIKSSSYFNQDQLVSDADFYDWLAKIKKTNYHPISQTTLKKQSNYFIPNNYQPQNLSLYSGLEKGVFDHYAKNSFVIPDRKMSLNFSHYYSSKMAELPSELYPLKPLAKGWTHTYNSYIYKVKTENDDYYYIVWPDGSIHIYNIDNRKYESIGVYDEFKQSSSTSRYIYITSKNQTRYRFKKIDSAKDIFYLIEIEDKNGNEINIEYESAEAKDMRRIEYVEAPSGKKLHFKYIKNFDLIERIQDPIDRRIYFDYSGLGSKWAFQYPVLVEFEDAKNNLTTYQYYGSNELKAYLLREIKLPKGNIIKASYSKNGKLQEYQFNDDKTQIDLEFDYNNGLYEVNSTVTRPVNGGTTKYEYEYNTLGLLKQYDHGDQDLTIKYPTSGTNISLPLNIDLNGLDVYYDYDDKGNVTKKSIENDLDERFYYNSDNTLRKYKDQNGNSTYYYYDSEGNITSIKDPLGNITNFTYDKYGQLLTTTNPEGINFEYKYENDGALEKITAPENTLITHTYDGINRLLTKTANGLTSKHAYDKNDNVTSFTNSMNYVTSYDYDKNDNLTKITNAKGNSTYINYNDDDQISSQTFGSSTKRFYYNDDKSLRKYKNPDGKNTYYDYDKFGRLVNKGKINIEYNNDNLISEISNVNGKINISYDKYNRVNKTIDNHNNNAQILYEYRENSQIENITAIDGNDKFITYYQYDKNNRLIKVQVNLNGTLKTIANYTYRKDGKLRHIEYNNGMKSYYSYDNLGRTKGIRHINPKLSKDLYSQSLNRDIRGNIIKDNSIYGVTWNGFSGAGTWSSNHPINYSYNNMNHMEKHIQYDSENNKKEWVYTTNKNGQTTFIDGKGWSNTVYEYNDFGTLAKYSFENETFEYNYNGLGQRIRAKRKFSNTTITTSYIRDMVNDRSLIERSSLQSKQKDYFYIHGLGLNARMTNNGETQYYHADVRGSTVYITDDTAGVREYYGYDEFGSAGRLDKGGTFNRYCYVGQYGVEYESNRLLYMRARYYDSHLGRFVSEDPIWSTNLYPYADNNPINRIDPMGTHAIYSIYQKGSIPGNTLILAEEMGSNFKAFYNHSNSTPKEDLCRAITAVGILFDITNKQTSVGKSAQDHSFDYMVKIARENARAMMDYYQLLMNEELSQKGKISNSTAFKYSLYSLYYNDFSRNIVLYSYDPKKLLFNLSKDLSCH